MYIFATHCILAAKVLHIPLIEVSYTTLWVLEDNIASNVCRKTQAHDIYDWAIVTYCCYFDVHSDMTVHNNPLVWRPTLVVRIQRLQTSDSDD